MDPKHTISRFETFLEEYYEDVLLDKIRKGTNHLVVDFKKVLNFEMDLATYLQDYPEEALKCFSIATERFDTNPHSKPKVINIRIKNLPSSAKVPINQIRSKHIDKFIKVEGIVKQKSKVLPHITSSRFECPSCNNVINVLQLDERKYSEPTRCGCGRRGKFKPLEDKTIDVFSVVLEETTEYLDGGSTLSKLRALLPSDLSDPQIERMLNQGGKVEITGILKKVSILSKGTKTSKCDYYLEANYVKIFNESFMNLKYTKKDIEEFHKLAKRKDWLQALRKSIFYDVYGFDEECEAIILQMFGGVGLERDGMDVRGTFHILLVGDPGNSKSAMLKIAQKFHPKARYVAGKGASAAGLGISAVRDELLGCYVGEAGILVLANNGLACIEENQLVLTNNGLKKIKHILPGDLVTSYNKKCVWNKVKYLINQGTKETIKIKLYTGTDIICTTDHKILTQKGWVEAGELTTKDFIKIPFTNPNVTNNTDFEHGFLSGFALSDIYYAKPAKATPNKKPRNNLSFSASTKNQERTDYIIHLLKKHYNQHTNIRTLNKQTMTLGGMQAHFQPSIQCFFNNKTFHSIVKDLFENNKLHKSTESFKIGFLAGILSTDTCISHKQGTFWLKREIVITPTRRKLTNEGNYMVLSLISELLHTLGVLSVIRKNRIIISSLRSYNRVYDIFHKYLIGRNKVKLIPITPKRKICSYDSFLDAEYVLWFKSIKFYTSRTVKLGLHSRIYYACKDNKVTVELMQTLYKYWSQITEISYRQPTKNYILNRVRSITKNKKSQVYDLTMEGVPNFVINGGIVHNCIDELDKVDKENLVALHEPLEQETCSIAKAGVQMTMIARTSILAAANPRGSSYSEYDDVYSQMDIAPSLINRFDFVFPIKESKLTDEDNGKIADKVLNRRYIDESKTTEYSREFIMKYISYAKQINPIIPEKINKELSKRYVRLKQLKRESLSKGIAALPITPRQIDGCRRIVESVARSRLAEEATPSDGEIGFNKLVYSLSQVGIDPNSGDAIETINIPGKKTKTYAKKDLYALIIRLIREMTKEGKLLDIDELISLLLAEGYDEETVEDAISKLKKSGDIFEPKPGWLKLAG